MSVYTERVTVTTSANQLVGNHAGGVLIQAPSADIYLGDEAVTTSTGFLLAAGQVFSATLAARDYVFGVVASGTTTAQVLLHDGEDD